MSGKISVLCVDENPADREALHGYAEILGWNITLSANCTDGYRHSASTRYDVIVADESLLDCDGVDIVDEIRTGDGPNRVTPILICAGGETDYLRDHLDRHTVDATIGKPILLSDFKLCIKNLAVG